jgi:hypothetical protein
MLPAGIVLFLLELIIPYPVERASASKVRPMIPSRLMIVTMVRVSSAQRYKPPNEAIFDLMIRRRADQWHLFQDALPVLSPRTMIASTVAFVLRRILSMECLLNIHIPTNLLPLNKVILPFK